MKVKLSDLLKKMPYGSDVVFYLVEYLGNKKTKTELRNLKETVKNYKPTISHPVINVNTHKTYSSQDLLEVRKDLALSGLKNIIKKGVRDSFNKKGIKAEIEIDLKGIGYLIYQLLLNKKEEEAELIEALLEEV